MLKRCACLLALCALLLTGCESGPKEQSVTFFAMDTYMTLRVWGGGSGLLSRAQARVEELAAALSVTEPDSEIARLDREGSAVLTPETAELLRRAMALCEETGGALDPAVYPVVKAWGFTTEKYRVPSQGEIDALLPLTDPAGLVLEGDRAVLAAGMEIDLGSVAKGYTGDVLQELLTDAGVGSALLDLGGNVHTVGARPDGSPWRIAVRDPAGEGTLGVVSVRDRAVVTSGGYERYFTDDEGNVWWHIMDPATGYPAHSGVISATVIAEEGLLCDALSTALFVMGPERAAEFWRSRGGFEMLLVTEDGTVLYTPGLADSFEPAQESPYNFREIA